MYLSKDYSPYVAMRMLRLLLVFPNGHVSPRNRASCAMAQSLDQVRKWKMVRICDGRGFVMTVGAVVPCVFCRSKPCCKNGYQKNQHEDAILVASVTDLDIRLGVPP